MFEAEINSGFTKGGDINISNRFTEISLLHNSSNGYTDVYKAKRYGQWHILKCLTPTANQDIQYKILLEKEFRIAYSLSHPNIVHTLGMEYVEDIGVCIIQEYVDGEQIRKLSRPQAIELCNAVEYIHKSGIIHRDIKPSNIIERKSDKHIVLIDFGLADKSDFSVLKGGAGTTGFAAPEQWYSGELSATYDIYGIGGVLELNKKFRRVAKKCKRTDPNKRYQTVESVKKAIQRKISWAWLVMPLLLIIGLASFAYSLQQQTKANEQQIILERLKVENSILGNKLDSINTVTEEYRSKTEIELNKSVEQQRKLKTDILIISEENRKLKDIIDETKRKREVDLQKY